MLTTKTKIGKMNSHPQDNNICWISSRGFKNLLDSILTFEEGMAQDLNYLSPLGESDHVCLGFNVLQSQRTNVKPPVHTCSKRITMQ